MDRTIKRMDVFSTLMEKPTRTLVSVALRALMNVLALSFKFEPKPENSKKPKSLDILKFKNLSKNIVENMLQKNCYLEKVTLDLSFISP